MSIASEVDAQPFPEDEEVFVFPMSFAQQRLWFLNQLDPASAGYNIPLAFRLRGNLDVAALARSLREIVRRHESLRTEVAVVDGEAMQVIHPTLDVQLPVLDMRAAGTEEQGHEGPGRRAQALIRQESRQPFTLSRAPLWRAGLYRLDARDHILSFTIHHILADGWSVGILTYELTALYSAYAAGRPSPLPELVNQYADFAHWQRQRLQGQLLEQQLAYWKRQLAGPLPLLQLPTDRPRPPIQTFHGATQSLVLPPALEGSIRVFSQREGASLFMTLLAAFQTLLYRYSGQEQILVGSPVANRDQVAVEDVIGLFVNTLVLRADLSDDPSFRDLLDRVRRVVLDAYAHCDLPFEKLVEELRLERDRSRTPLFQVMFVHETISRASAELPGLTLKVQEIDYATAKFDCTLQTLDTGDSLTAVLEYNTDLFDAATAARMLAHYQMLLQAAVRNPDQRVSRLGLLTAEEQAFLGARSRAQTDRSPSACLHERFEAQVARTPGAVALVLGQQQLTYAALNERAGRLAHTLRTLGVGPDSLVGLCAERSIELVVGIIGILKAGGAYLPLDPAYPPERLALMIEDAGVRVLLTATTDDRRPTTDRRDKETRRQADKERGRSAISNLQSAISQSNGQRTVVDLMADWDQVAQEPVENANSSVSADNLAYVIYTSGSTGRPKGVQVSHANVARLFESTQSWFQFGAHDRWTLFHSYAFDFSVWELWGALLYGGRLVIVPYWVSRGPESFHELLCREQVTVLNQTPSAFRQLARADEMAAPDTRLALRLVIFGGEALELQHVRPWFERHGDHTPQLVNMYGITETTVHVTIRPLTVADLHGGAPSVIGAPLPDLHLHVLDRHLQPTPIGVAGQIFVGGAGVARGYLNRPELTAERFVPNPFVKDEGERMKDEEGRLILHPSSFILYKTGDLARYLASGELEYLGRIDQQVKIRGFRIELGEIEAALYAHPGVQEALVLSREDLPGDKRLVAYVVPTNDQRPTTNDQRQGDKGTRRQGDSDYATHNTQYETPSSILHPLFSILGELRGFLKQTLPEYMLPSAFVVLEALPLTPNGKVDRRALPAPEASRLDPGGSTTLPRDPVEEILAEIWAEVLGLEQVGVHDDLFELGAHSLLATQVVSRIRSALRVELPLRQLFETPTIAGLATAVTCAPSFGGIEHPRLQRQPRTVDMATGESRAVASFAQQRVWFLEQLEPGSRAYHIPVAIRMSGPLGAQALEAALAAVVRRHEVLRTSFAAEDAQPIQVIRPAASATAVIRLPTVDLHGLPEREQQAQVWRLSVEGARRPFDLTRGPLLRATLLRLGATEHILALVLHHIVFDGWSMGVLMRELSQLYRGYAATGAEAAPESSLPELPLQYADFAIWQRRWLQGQGLQAQLAYWKDKLRGPLPPLHLPTDRPRPAAQTFHGATQQLVLPAVLSASLKSLGRSENATLFMTLLAAFEVLLYRYSWHDDIVVGAPIANRNRAELEPLIGYFANTLALRTDLSGEPRFRELLRRVRQTALEAYEQQDVPFEQVVDAVHPERDLSRTPLFQVVFMIQNNPLPELQLRGLSLTALELDTETAKFDLTMSVAEGADGILAALEYNTDLFDAESITRMLGHFQTLLWALIVDADRSIATLPLLSEAERRQLLIEWNQPGAALTAAARELPAEDLCIHTLFERQALLTPDATALAYMSQQLSYHELDRRANRLAQQLRTLGVGPERLVGICVERSAEMVIGLLAILKAGGAYLPLDPAYPPERLAFILQDSRATVLLTATTDHRPPTTDHRQEDKETRRQGDDESGTQHSTLNTQNFSSILHPPSSILDLYADWPAIVRRPASCPGQPARPENLAYVIYTSGSTGRPKGVQIPHRAAVNFLRSMRREPGLTAEDTLFAVTTLSFDIAALEIFLPLSAGASVVVVPREVAADGLRLRESLRETGATVMQATPATWQLLVEAGWRGEETPRLRKILCGGEALPRKLGQALLASGAEVWNLYGPTETTIWSSAQRVEPGAGAVPLGRPIASTQLYLLDAQMQPVPLGVLGQLYIGGLGLSRGYLNRPDLTAERFVPNPFARVEDGGWRMEDGDPPSSILHPPSSRLYKTGDLARYLPNGDLEFLGRVDHQVKVRGYRIELGEIEAALHMHPRVQEALVLSREDLPGDKRLVAYVVPTNDQRPTRTRRQGDKETRRPRNRNSTLNTQHSKLLLHPPSSILGELRGFLKTQLPDYMLPSAVVVLPGLPRMPNGKVDRRALPAPSQEGLGSAAYVAPRDALELQLTEIWEDLFGIQPIGVTRNFFDLGGHSLLAVRLMAQIHLRLGRELPLAALFQGATIERLAGYLRRQPHAAPASVLVRLASGGLGEPLFWVHPIGGNVLCYQALARPLGARRPVYGLQAPGLSGEQPPLTRVEDMAAQYIAAIRGVQPNGPYLLAGWSFGGLVAFEIAQQLRRQGQPVAFLGLLDSQPPAHSPPRDEAGSFLAGFVADLAALLGMQPPEWSEDWASLTAHDVLAILFEQARAAALLPPGVEVAHLQALLRVYEANARAEQAYRPQPYPSSARLFQAAASSNSSDGEPGWRAWIQGGLAIERVRGDHYDMLGAAHAEALAERIESGIDADISALEAEGP
jgi:amino acid adenylation domain-containing protein